VKINFYTFLWRKKYMKNWIKIILLTIILSACVFMLFSGCAGTKPALSPNDLTVVDGIKIGDKAEGKGKLIWRDEFDGDSLDPNKWNYDIGVGIHYDQNLWGWGNNEKQYYFKDNVRVEKGKLIIEAKKDPSGMYGIDYTSGKITTAGTYTPDGIVSKRKFITPKTGYVEARIKSPKGEGFWPGFWLVGANLFGYSGFKKVSWPKCGEIDIFEAKGHELHTVYQTIHYGSKLPDKYWFNSHKTQVAENIGDNYHVYGVGWDKTSLKFYIDGNLTQTIDFPLPEEADGANSKSFYNGPGFAVQFNLAIGGYFLSADAASVPDNSVFESPDWETRSMMVDWVRFYDYELNI
jgi:beta-glucanase (GH16 family)